MYEILFIYCTLFLTYEKVNYSKSFVKLKYCGWDNIWKKEGKSTEDACNSDPIQENTGINKKLEDRLSTFSVV